MSSMPKQLCVCAAFIGCTLLLHGCGGGGGRDDEPYHCHERQIEAGCASCEDIVTCTTCKPGLTIQSSRNEDKVVEVSCGTACTVEQTLKGCTGCRDSTYCTLCSEGSFARLGTCDWGCSEEQLKADCEVCDGSTKCLECKEHMALTEGKCTWDCNQKQVEHHCTVCKNAPATQFSHVTVACTKCEEGFALKDDICVSECLALGEDDLAKPLGLEPEVRNGYEFQRMCVDEEVAHFFAIADWGGAFFQRGPGVEGNYIYGDGAAADNTRKKPWGYNDNGLDKEAQKKVGEAMAARALTVKPRFVVNSGDSFYWGGFEELGCGGDPKAGWEASRWKKVFESKYNIPHPTSPTVQVPWLSVLGNHDFGGLHYDSGWDHLVYYTYKPGGTHWRMPGLYWSQKVFFRTFLLELFMLDGNYADARPLGVDGSHNICNRKTGRALGKCTGPGYEDFNQGNCFQWHAKSWKTQMDWLQTGLSTSKADWTAVVTHFPANSMNPILKAKMLEFGVDLVLMGHTHWMVMGQVQHGGHCQQSSPCDVPLDVISGGGGGISSEGAATPNNFMYGFTDIQMTATKVTVQQINLLGKEGSKWVLPRRKKLARGESAAQVV